MTTDREPFPENTDDEVRACFIQAFKELYPEQGMRGITGAALAKRAGYSRSTFYRTFESVYDVLRLVEIEATPYREMNYLLDNVSTVDMREVTDVFLEAFGTREDVIRMLVLHSEDNRYRERMHDCLLPVFRALAERVYEMEPVEYDLLAEYITHAKLGLLVGWAQGLFHMGLGHMTQITDSVFEGGMWDRIEKSAQAQAQGKPFERTPLSYFKKTYPWVADRPLLEP